MVLPVFTISALVYMVYRLWQQSSIIEHPVPKTDPGDPDQETLFVESQNKTGQEMSEQNEDTVRAESSNSDNNEDLQQQPTTDSQRQTELSPTHAWRISKSSIETDPKPNSPRPRVQPVVAESDSSQHSTFPRGEIQEEESSTASEVSALPPVSRENVLASTDEIQEGALAVSACQQEIGTAVYTYDWTRAITEREALSSQQALVQVHQAPALVQQTLVPAHQALVNVHQASPPVQQAHVPVQQDPLQEPPQDWIFDKMLAKLSKMIQSDDLEIMKFRFESSLKKSVTEKITLPIHLFRKMKERQFINANNLIYLQAILLETDKQELIDVVTSYCEKTKNVLHFKQAEPNPVNGFRYVRFHLYLDKEYTRHEFTKLQTTLAKILDLDLRFVFVVGVEPSCSLLVTIMLPDKYVNLLVTKLDQNLPHDSFAALGIDTITIDEKVYEIPVSDEPGVRRSDKQLISLYHQLSNRDLQLEGMENTCNQLEQKIEQLEKQEAAKTAQLVKSEERQKQLMAKVEMLEIKVESKAILIEESEKKNQQLEQKFEDLEKQGASSNALLQENLNKCNLLEKRIESIENGNKKLKSLNAKLEQLEQENRDLVHVKGVLNQDISFYTKETNSLNNKIHEKDQVLLKYREMMETIYDCHSHYIQSLADKLTKLESDIVQKFLRYRESSYMHEDKSTLSKYCKEKLKEVQNELNNFDEEQYSNIPDAMID